MEWGTALDSRGIADALCLIARLLGCKRRNLGLSDVVGCRMKRTPYLPSRVFSLLESFDYVRPSPDLVSSSDAHHGLVTKFRHRRIVSHADLFLCLALGDIHDPVQHRLQAEEVPRSDRKCCRLEISRSCGTSPSR